MARIEFADAQEIRSVAARRAAGEAVPLPVEYNEYVALTLWLEGNGLWKWLQSQVLSRRAGAYELCDVVAFLFAHFSGSAKRESFADFAERSQIHGLELASLLGRLRWISQGSLSRGLEHVTLPLAREVSRRLLLASSTLAAQNAVVRDAGYLDSLGARWEVFHWDATTTTLRARALPEDDSLPPAHRLGSRMAASGYAGRKRGELQVARSTVSEATTALWLEADMQPGNGTLRDQLQRGAAAVGAYLGDDGARRARAVVIADGVSGGHPQAIELRAGGLSFVTRSNAYSALQTPAALHALQTGQWRAVDDSRSGPRREALELGVYHVTSELACRMVVSRFKATSSKHGAGTTLDGWHYELYLSDLPSEGWAAEDLVRLYYGRTAIENRFAAEDREFGLDRILSCNLPGQMLACAVALCVWNFRLMHGLALTKGATPERLQATRPTPACPPEEPGCEPAVEGSIQRSDDRPDPESEQAPQTTAASEVPELRSNDRLVAAMQAWCATHPGWSVDAAAPALRCPVGSVLRLSAIRYQNGADVARFRENLRKCSACPLRGSCAPTATAQELRREVNLRFFGPPVPTEPRAQKDVAAPETPTRLVLHTHAPKAPPRMPLSPALLPAVIRRLTTNALATLNIAVRIKTLDPDIQRQVHLALTDANRQRRRLSIEQRIALNARPNADATEIQIVANQAIARWLADPTCQPPA